MGNRIQQRILKYVESGEIYKAIEVFCTISTAGLMVKREWSELQEHRILLTLPLEEIQVKEARIINTIIEKSSSYSKHVNTYNKITNEVTFRDENERNRIEELLDNKRKRLTKNQDDNWYDRPVKDKIKLTLPFLFFKWEREYDVTGVRLPRTWQEFKDIFLRQDNE